MLLKKIPLSFLFFSFVGALFQNSASGMQHEHFEDEAHIKTSPSESVLMIKDEEEERSWGAQIADHHLWLKSLGKLVFLYGTSSAGKTSLAQEAQSSGWIHIEHDEVKAKLLFTKIQEAVPDEWNFLNSRFSFENWIEFFSGWSKNIKSIKGKEIKTCQNKILYSFHQVREDYKPHDHFMAVYQEALPHLLNGKNVIIDTVFLEDKHLQLMKSVLNGYPSMFILYYCPLDLTLKRCDRRNNNAFKVGSADFRMPLRVMQQFSKMYSITTQKGLRSLEVIFSDNYDEMLQQSYIKQRALEKLLEAERKVSREEVCLLQFFPSLESRTPLYIESRLEFDHLLCVSEFTPIHKVIEKFYQLSRKS